MTTLGRPVSAVLHDIVSNAQDIVRSEVRLAKTELREELVKSRSAAILLAAGALLLSLGALFVLLAVFLSLSLVMPGWAAALTVAGGVGLAAALCLARGLKKFKELRAAPKTAASMKENIQWAKQAIR
jgi:hypothetical protein